MNKGFTLIELMVVVLIIGILSAVALPEYTLAVERSRSAEALVNGKAVVDSVQRHLQMYPGETVTTAAQLADVKLGGGTTSTWNNGFYTTTNFIYKIINNGVEAKRTKQDGGGAIYTITFEYMPSSDTIKVTCEAVSDYERVCNAVNKLYSYKPV